MAEEFWRGRLEDRLDFEVRTEEEEGLGWDEVIGAVLVVASEVVIVADQVLERS